MSSISLPYLRSSVTWSRVNSSIMGLILGTLVWTQHILHVTNANRSLVSVMISLCKLLEVCSQPHGRCVSRVVSFKDLFCMRNVYFCKYFTLLYKFCHWVYMHEPKSVYFSLVCYYWKVMSDGTSTKMHASNKCMHCILLIFPFMLNWALSVWYPAPLSAPYRLWWMWDRPTTWSCQDLTATSVNVSMNSLTPCIFTYQGYPAKRAPSAMRKHGG